MSGNSCPCDTGYYDANVGIDLNCNICHFSCKECSGITENDCTFCPDNPGVAPTFRVNTVPTCPCAPGYGEVNQANCVLCVHKFIDI